MQLNFSDAKIQDLCCNQSALLREFGSGLARKIACRLAVLAAAPTLADVPVGLPVGLVPGARQGSFSVALGSKHHLLFQAIPVEAATGTGIPLISKLLIIGPVPGPAPKAKRS